MSACFVHPPPVATPLQTNLEPSKLPFVEEPPLWEAPFFGFHVTLYWSRINFWVTLCACLGGPTNGEEPVEAAEKAGRYRPRISHQLGVPTGIHVKGIKEHFMGEVASPQKRSQEKLPMTLRKLITLELRNVAYSLQ